MIYIFFKLISNLLYFFIMFTGHVRTDYVDHFCWCVNTYDRDFYI